MENLNFIYQVILNIVTFVLLVAGLITYITNPKAFTDVMLEFKSKEIGGTMIALSVISLVYFSAFTSVFVIGSLLLMYGLDFLNYTKKIVNQ